jgi:hypothetical protein
MRRLGVFVTLAVALMAATASAQQVPVKDVRSVLEASMRAQGWNSANTNWTSCNMLAFTAASPAMPTS